MAVRRILGNIGKPGLTILVPPSEDMMVREIDYGHWVSSTMTQFDGSKDDLFGGTSLHLSFSSYHVPVVETDTLGRQDSSVSILESIVSVRYRGSWVADIDVLAGLQASNVFRMRAPAACEHPKNSAPGFPLTVIESWDDIIDLPDDQVVILAHGNWVARLAVVALLGKDKKKKADRVTICPPELCWKCVNPGLGSGQLCTVYVY